MNIQSLRGKKILVTGGSGVVGSALLPRLEGAEVTCLIRKNPTQASGVNQVLGDVSKANLGLDQVAWDRLAAELDFIVHSAAITNFQKPEAEIMATNVQGTGHVLALAAQRNIPFYYISTAFTHNRLLPDHLSEYSCYCQSKRQAEELVRQSGVPYLIIRPSIVVGCSQTGQISTFQGMHTILDAILKGVVPVIPSEPGSYIDFVPADLLCNIIVGLMVSGIQNEEHWITAGNEALDVTRILDVLASFSKARNHLFARPRLMNPDVVERLFRPVFLPTLPKLMRAKMEMLLNYACYIHTVNPFPSTVQNLAERIGLPVSLNHVDVLLANLNYWAERKMPKTA